MPIWRESLAGLDWLALRTSPVFYGCGVPRGDGAGVVLVPGFLGTDWYLLERNGKPPPPWEDCLKETFFIRAGERIVVDGGRSLGP